MGFIISKVSNAPERWIRKATAGEEKTSWHSSIHFIDVVPVIGTSHGRFMKLILEGEGGALSATYTEQQLANYHQNFNSMSISKAPTKPYIDQTAFSSFLSRHFQSLYPPFAVAAPILYKIAITHAAYPFSTNPPDSLSADSLLRAVTMLTGRVHRILRAPSIIGDGTRIICPDRSERDIRRLIFQSLAVPADYVDLNKEKQRVDLTNDDLADVRLVASRTQPRPNECLMPRLWPELLPMAMRLSEQHIPLKDLRIPYEVLRQLLKLLLAVQSFDQPTSGTREI